MTVTAYIGLGSNLGDSFSILTDAVEQLKTLGKVRLSKIYQSPPMGPQDQPDYLNAVAEVKTDLQPLALLAFLQKVEQDSGRVRLRHWGERTLDLDLLLYGTQNINHPNLTVPHVGILERDFVLLPLLDLDVTCIVAEQKIANLAVVQQSTLKPAQKQWNT